MKPHQEKERLWLLESKARLKRELEGAKRTTQEFMDIMQDYLARQQDDPNFDPRTQIYDLYDDLVNLYESNL